MCGLAGVCDFKHDISNQKPIFHDMMKTIKNRGPNDEGIYTNRHVALIHTRLAVVDPENGQQPMFTSVEKNKYILIYDGELYNTGEIRHELSKQGFEFNSHSDTEVVLKAYIYWKEKCVEHFNGIFAFAIWDEEKRALFIARDRIGVKPLFYAQVHDTFIFGSEIKTLLAHPLLEAEIDATSIAEIMLIGPGRTPGYGVFRNIYELKAGEYAYLNEEGIHKKTYYQLIDQVHTHNETRTIKKVHDLVYDAIKRQLVADVPIGTFLSGGLDSSIITSIAASILKEKGKQLKTFSVDYVDNDVYFKPTKFQPNSDNEYINIMVDYVKSDHTTIKINADELVDCLFDAVDARDLPGMADVDASLLLFGKEVRKHITVAISGECADEIFGGYPWYRDEETRNYDGFPWSQNIEYRASFLQDCWLENIEPNAYVYEKYQTTCREASVCEDVPPLDKRMKEMMNLNIQWFMQTLLDRSDRMSMSAGLEVRVPFCDYRILDYLYHTPWSLKDYHDREKGLLRVAMKDILPEEILWRKKSPFPKTHNPAYLNKLRIKLDALLQDSSAKVWQIIKPEAAEKLLHDEVSQPWYGQLMTTPQTIAYFLQIDYWLKKYKIKIIQE